MRIDSYSFGKITVDGKSFSSDVIIYRDRVYSPWWRKEGHRLGVADLSEVIKAGPEVLIIGTGASGVMKVPEETISALTAEGIEVRVERTPKAVELFNSMAGKKIVIAALHLTC